MHVGYDKMNPVVLFQGYLWFVMQSGANRENSGRWDRSFASLANPIHLVLFYSVLTRSRSRNLKHGT